MTPLALRRYAGSLHRHLLPPDLPCRPARTRSPRTAPSTRPRAPRMPPAFVPVRRAAPRSPPPPPRPGRLARNRTSVSRALALIAGAHWTAKATSRRCRPRRHVRPAPVAPVRPARRSLGRSVPSSISRSASPAPPRLAGRLVARHGELVPVRRSCPGSPTCFPGRKPLPAQTCGRSYCRAGRGAAESGGPARPRRALASLARLRRHAASRARKTRLMARLSLNRPLCLETRRFNETHDALHDLR